MNRYPSLAALGCLLGLAGTSYAAEPEPAAKAPRTAAECRQLVLKEIAEFGNLKGPIHKDDDDIHTMRAGLARFHTIKQQVMIGLAFGGDRDAVAGLVKQFDLEQEDDKAWARQYSQRDYGVYHSWTPTLMTVSAALEPARPELARKVRRRMLLVWEVETDPKPADDSKALDRLTLAELKQAVEAGERGEATRRWARLDPDGAKPWLAERMNDGKAEINVRFDAAFALARIGDERGLDWLKDACFKNLGLGAGPGAALLESGEAGAALYFKLVERHERDSPEKPLPYELAHAPESLSSETLFKYLPQLLSLRDKNAAYEVRYTLRWKRLTAYQLAFLAEHLRKQKYEDDTLGHSIWHALSWKGPADGIARQAAGLWVDELHSSKESKAWELGARIFLATQLGSREPAAAAARHHLKESPALAAQVLAETGRPEDAVLIWEATHKPGEKKQENWYNEPADGWLPILRLTAPLRADPK